MLEALLDDLTSIGGMDIVITRDSRLEPIRQAVRTVRVGPGSELEDVLQQGLAGADAIWPVAPESEGILERVCRIAAASGTLVIGCAPDAIAVAASKSATSEVLARHGIAALASYRNPADVPAGCEHLVIKPDDGAGCVETLLFTRADALAWWARHGSARFVVQPYVRGEALSLSVLCTPASAEVISCNVQHVHPEEGVFKFRGVSVNADPVGRQRYQALASKIAGALPGLWGYVGIDLIETIDGPVVVEINPRVTTSYAGLKQALGTNIAARVLAGLRASGTEALATVPSGVRVEVETDHEH